MNKENAHLFLPFVQALIEGKTIQYRSGSGTWIDMPEPSFAPGPSEYRIKPEPPKPREWWARVSIEGNGTVLPGNLCGGSDEKTFGRPDSNDKWEYVKVREVLQPE